jgi:hypothetical protein
LFVKQLIMKFKALLVLSLFICSFSFATHNKGGEITYRHISGFTYEITITTYTHTAGISLQADRPVLDSVFFGDGVFSSFPRVSFVDLAGDPNDPNNIRVNTYINTHTYAGEGHHTIRFTDPNRNEGILNIPNSVNVPFSTQTDITVYNPFIHCVNNSVIPSITPIFLSTPMAPYIHNVSAFDPDRDSLSFELIPCNSGLNIPVPGYSYPTGITINSSSGEIKWSQNALQGIYNIAVKITEWRQQIKVGYVVRDFEIIVSAANASYHFGNTNSIPVDLNGNYSMHIQPGDSINLSFYFEDSVPPHVSLRVLQEIFFSNAPVITVDTVSTLHRAMVTFHWTPDSSQSRNHPYIFVFRGKTDGSGYALEDDLSLMVFIDGTYNDTCPAFPDFYAPVIAVADTTVFNIVLFPNPTRDKITMQISSGNSEINFDLYNAFGEKIKSFSNISSGFQFSMKDFSKGVYMYKCSTDGKAISVGKLIKE